MEISLWYLWDVYGMAPPMTLTPTEAYGEAKESFFKRKAQQEAQPGLIHGGSPGGMNKCDEFIIIHARTWNHGEQSMDLTIYGIHKCYMNIKL